jgi:phosphoribosylaminoimidazole carboxylase (NCAIR synthetase)
VDRTLSFAWVLNFDAEDELASATATTTSRAMRARFAEIAERAKLLAPGDVVIDEALADASSYEGRAWCPTPSALAKMRAAGVRVPRAPSIDVLRRVNSRRFCAELGQTLPDAAFVETADACARAIASRAGTWLLKRAFGFAGRGRRRVTSGALTDDDMRWIEASRAGIQCEPLVAIERDYALHGELDERGALTLGAPTAQRCDASGAWIASERADDLADGERSALERETRAVARALADAGYFGPFGVDAYRFRDGDARAFNPRGEINARYTMGWSVGMHA